MPGQLARPHPGDERSSHGRLDTRPRQWGGIVLMLAVCWVMGVVLPRYADGTLEDNVTEGLLLLSNGDASFILNAPVEASGTSAVELADELATVQASDETLHYKVGDPQDFTTDSGLEGASIVVANPSDTSFVVSVTDGQLGMTADLFVVSDQWAAISSTIDPMLASIEIADPSTDATTEGSP